ncbi:MAG: hypothetical protein AAGF92_23325 [Myxococcota bacterium]
MQRYLFLSLGALLSVLLVSCSDDGGDANGAGGAGGGSAGDDCDFDSTFAAIQQTIFDDGGCTTDACHGASFEASGGLDLREGASYAALVNVPSSVNSEIDRVFPGDQDLSLLYRKLSETTQELAVDGLGQEMPLGGSRLTEDQLDALRLWIRGGASEDAIVEGTLEKLGCEGSFAADPNKIVPLPPPAPDEGVQFYAGGWDIAGESEDEVCYATYYDFTDVVPDDFQVDCPEFGEGRRCFAFGRNELAQDALSHHSIINVFTRVSDPNGSEWGPWACLGGENAGAPCDPTDAGVCGERSACTTPPQTSVACVGYAGAPPDFSLGATLGGSDAGVQVQLSGAQESTFIDSPPEGVYSRLPLTGFVAWNSHGFNLTSQDTTIEQWVNLTFVPESGRTWLREQIFESQEIFSMSTVAPFTKREICMTWTLPQYSQLLSLSSHMHERGELFRIWLPPHEPCENGVVGCDAPSADPDYVSRLYDDPVYTYYDPALSYNEEDAASRTFKACARYDNGADDPFQVKRNSAAPNTPVCSFILAYCGCPQSQRACLGGDLQGESCGGDSACGAEGVCDACPVFGGVTTDDEMFIPLGSYFVQPPAP